MKRDALIILIVTVLFGFASAAFSQNPPAMGLVPDDTIIVETGANYIILPEIDDGDTGEDQNISFTATSSSNDTLSIDSVSYTTGENFAVLYVHEQGLTGTVTIDVEINDGDGTDSQSFDVLITTFTNAGINAGINYEIHDILFHDEVDPLGLNPIFDTVVQKTIAPVNYIDWDKIPIVAGGCVGGWCDGHDFLTTIFHGYIIPPETGDYTFYQEHQNDDAMWLSMDADHSNSELIIYNGDKNTAGVYYDGLEWKSAPYTLEAGNVYAMHAVQWSVHEEKTTISWEGPGINKQPIPGEYLLHTYDTVRPTIPGNFELFKKGVTDMLFRWTPSTDNELLTGYNIYLDGIKVNSAAITDTLYNITGLIQDTKYSVAVTAIDVMENESFLSPVITASTYPSDAVAPGIVSGLDVDDATGLAVKVVWDHSTDNETEVRGYDIYLDGEKYNTGYIYDTTVLIKDLMPETAYNLVVIAVDAAYNESDSSASLQANTTKFEVGDNLGVKNGRFSVKMNPITWNHGMGVNFPNPYGGSPPFVPSDSLLQHIAELNVGALRWLYDWGLSGTCDNFAVPDKDYFMGATIDYSIGDFMHLANQHDAYTILSVTMQEDGNYVSQPERFLDILEYFAGPETSTWGAKRAAEGYTEELFDTSRGLIIEFGNEVWGGDGHCIPIGKDYEEYASWCKSTDSIIKASSYYDSDKIFTSYSGRNPRPSYSYGLNDKLFEGGGDVDWIALSGYIGGNFDYDKGVDPGNSEMDYLKNGYAEMLGKIRGLKETNMDALTLSGEIKPIWFYEGTMTTSHYFGRFGQAIIYMDYLLAAMEEGAVVPCLFSMYTKQWKMIDKNNDNKRFPLFKMASCVNEYCKGDVLETNFETTNEIRDANGYVLNGDPIGSYAYHNDGDYSIVLINRSFEEDCYVQLNLPDTLTYNTDATKYVFTSDHFSSFETNIDESNMSLLDSMMVKVPKYGMVLIHLEGTDQDFEQLPLGFYGDYIMATSVEITCAEGTNIIKENGGGLHLSATVYPDSVFVNDVIWEIEESSMNVLFSSGVIMAPQTGTGQDTITVKAISGDRMAFGTYDVIIDLGEENNIDEKTRKSNGIEIYPNPAKDIINIESANAIYGIEINSMTGSRLYIEKCSGEQVKTVNIENLQSGMYIISVFSENNSKHISYFIKR